MSAFVRQSEIRNEDFDWGVKEFESSKFAKGCDQPASP